MIRLITILTFISTTVFSQALVNLDPYFSQLRSGKSPNIPSEVLKPENAKTVLNALPVYAKDTVVIVRSKATLIARIIGVRSTEAAIHFEIIEQPAKDTWFKELGNLSEFKQ